MRKDASDFAKNKYFNGYSYTRSVQENFDLITSFVQESAEKHIPSKTSGSTSSFPLITPELEGRFVEEMGHMLRLKRLAVAN